MSQTCGENLRHWWVKELNQLELIRGENSGHSFPRHFHSGFSIGIIEDGQREYHYGGIKHLVPAGAIVVINPGEVHSCSAETILPSVLKGTWGLHPADTRPC